MATSDKLRGLSHFVNLVIFMYLSFTLIKLGLQDIIGILISFFGILGSIIVDIISEFEKLRE